MSKKKFIVGALSLCMVLAGTGYAYWTDSLNITTKATTGNMDVKFLDLAMYSQYGEGPGSNDGWGIIDGIPATEYPGFVPGMAFNRNTSYDAIQGAYDYDARSNMYTNVSYGAVLTGDEEMSDTWANRVGPYVNCRVSDKIEIDVNNIYPGYAQAFRTDIANVGSIAALLSQIDVKASGANDVTKDMIGVALYGSKEETQNGHWVGNAGDVFGLANDFDAEDIFSLGGVDFVRLSALENADVTISDANNDLLVIPSDNRMDVFLGIAMDPDVTGEYTTGSINTFNAANNDARTMDKKVTITCDFLWDQFNVGRTNADANILENQNSGTATDEV